MNIREYVPANEIWPNATTYIDKGYKPGLVRGYNVECINKDGNPYWFSCEYIHGDPDEELFDDFHMSWYADCGCTPTGRISFRGYGVEVYDACERDYFIKDIHQA